MTLVCSCPPYVMNRPHQERRLLLGFLAATVLLVVELFGGFLSGSLAIMSDALHLASDAASLFIGYMASKYSRKAANNVFTFGFSRAELLGALVSIVALLTVTIQLVLEATIRIIVPPSINTKIMLITAIIGVLGNLVLGFILAVSHRSSDSFEQAFTIKAALLHVLGDLVQSVGVLLSAILLHWKPSWTIIDPLCTFAFSIVVFSTSVPLFRHLVIVLMDAAPDIHVYEQTLSHLQAYPSIKVVKDLHIWSPASGINSIIASIEVGEDFSLHELKKTLHDRFTHQNIEMKIKY